MKHLRNLLTALSFVSLFIFASCNGDSDGGNDPDPASEQASKLVNSWTINSNGARLDGDAVTGWDNFDLTITGDKDGGGFNTTGSPSEEVWPAIGTWTFDGNDISTVVRNDDVNMAVTVTNNALTLSFTVSEGGGTNRSSGIEGDWVFSFSVE
jgi:hypothetical protein